MKRFQTMWFLIFIASIVLLPHVPEIHLNGTLVFTISTGSMAIIWGDD